MIWANWVPMLLFLFFSPPDLISAILFYLWTIYITTEISDFHPFIVAFFNKQIHIETSNVNFLLLASYVLLKFYREWVILRE